MASRLAGLRLVAGMGERAVVVALNCLAMRLQASKPCVSIAARMVIDRRSGLPRASPASRGATRRPARNPTRRRGLVAGSPQRGRGRATCGRANKRSPPRASG
jgi:hypothetical protein